MTAFLRRLLKQEQELPALNVTMLGPSGVGKTSLLAAMYDQFENVSQDLQLVADEDIKPLLDGRLKELKSLVGDSIKVRGGLKQTGEPRSFRFELGETGAAASLEINFQDYPGEYLEQSGRLQEVKGFIRDSAAVLIPIDTAALIEKEGMYHDRFNQPSELNDLFKKVYKDLDSPRLVILVPVKCEKYMQENAPELFRRVKEGYQKILNQFASDKLLSKVAVAIAPVQTVGSVVFSRVENDEDRQPIFYYRKPQPKDPYQPQNTEVPLRYLLRFLVKLHLDKRAKNPLYRVLDSFNSNASLRNAVSRFALPRRDEVEIVQGLNLLNL